MLLVRAHSSPAVTISKNACHNLLFACAPGGKGGEVGAGLGLGEGVGEGAMSAEPSTFVRVNILTHPQKMRASCLAKPDSAHRLAPALCRPLPWPSMRHPSWPGQGSGTGEPQTMRTEQCRGLHPAWAAPGLHAHNRKKTFDICFKSATRPEEHARLWDAHLRRQPADWTLGSCWWQSWPGRIARMQDRVLICIKAALRTFAWSMRGKAPG